MTEQENTVTEEVKEGTLLTEVTSVQKEEEKTGVKQKIPTPEELVARAAMSMTQYRRQLMTVMEDLSKKATARVINSILDLPMEGLPVYLKSDEEKLAFALGQRILSDRFIIIQHHINEEMKRIKKEREESVLNNQTTENVNERSETQQ